MNGFLVGGALAALVYALTRRASTSTTSSTPRSPVPSPAPAPSPSGRTLAVLAGVNVPDFLGAHLVSSAGVAERVSAALPRLVSQFNASGQGTIATSPAPRVSARDAPYGSIVTIVFVYSGSLTKEALAARFRELLLAQGGDVASHLRELSVVNV